MRWVAAVVLVLAGCASEEQRMAHQYVHEKGLPHSHVVGEPMLPNAGPDPEASAPETNWPARGRGGAR